MSEAKVELGRRLFYDRRLSVNETQSCASCHQQARAFTDGRARAVGATGETHPRSAMSLTNVAYNKSFGWADPRLASLEAQMAVPMFNEAPIELGLRGHEAEVLERLGRDRGLRRQFARAFPERGAELDLAHVRLAIAAFERTLVSGRSAYDRYVYADDRAALSAPARRGLALFTSDRLHCADCHGGPAFAGREPRYENTGLYNLGNGLYPPGGEGLFALSRRPEDMGRFRPPGLRNVALTAPYMHDGSVATLAEVVVHYARGGRNWATPTGGQAARNPHQSAVLGGFALDLDEQRALVAFLESLTDEAFVRDPRFADPGELP
jgi:cytochrome c peroxidase